MICTATVWPERVVYEVRGPLGYAKAEGPKNEFVAIRDKARVAAGLPPVSTS